MQRRQPQRQQPRQAPGRRVPTPAEIGDMMTEDIGGLPVMSGTTDAATVDPVGLVGQETSPAAVPPNLDAKTCAQTCLAKACVNNADGLCRLDTININEFGGCKEYTATAGEHDGARYEEEETSDMTGGAADGSAGDEMAGPRGANEPWDPQGSAY